MNRWLFLLGLGALLTAARAELPVDLPTDTPTNRPGPGINVPAPLGTDEPTNTVVIPPNARPLPPQFSLPSWNAGVPWRRIEAPAEATDRLTYTNGDRFAGAFLGVEDGMIRWQPALLDTPVRLRAAGCEELTFKTFPRAGAPAPAGWLVFLADGSLLPARQVTVEEGKVVADLAYAGQVRLDRRQVAALRRCETSEGGLVTFGDAPLYAAEKTNDWPRVRHRDTSLPDPMLLEFAWDCEVASILHLRLYAGKGEDLGRPPAFDFKLHPDGVTVTCEGKPLTLSADLGNCVGRTVWVGLAVNRKKGEAVFYLDGQRQSHAVLERLPGLSLPESGLAVVERPRRRLAPRGVLVSRIHEDLTLPVPSTDRDAVRLTNGDQLAGRLELVTTNELLFQAAVGRMTLPLERVAQISLPRDTNAPARAGEVRLGLFDGSHLLGVWQRTDAQSVVIQNRVLGAMTVPRSAVAEVVGLGPRASRDADPLWELERLQLPAAKKLVLAEQWRMSDSSWMHLIPAFWYRPGLVELPLEMSWHGELLGIADGVARWRHPASPDLWSVPLASVRRIFPLARSLPDAPATERATVRLVNGDVLSGALGAAGAETVNLTPWYAGPLAIPRRHAALVTPHPAPADAIDMKWQALNPEEPAPLAADGALWFESIGRGVRRSGPIPDRVRLDFEVVWPPAEPLHNPRTTAGPTEVQVEFGDVGNPMGARLRAAVSAPPRHVDCGWSLAGRGSNRGWMMDGLANITRGGCLHITLLADRTKSYLRLLVDGQPAAELRDAKAPVPAGSALSLSAGGYMGAALRHIVLREWRGDPPAPPASQPVAVSPLLPGEVRVVFHSGDFLTLSDIAADERTVTGKHQLLGPVSLNMAAVRSLSWERPPGGAGPAKR